MAEETYERLFLAKGQLDTALELFLDQRNYSSAITLAGAAEEIFGRALTLRDGKSASVGCANCFFVCTPPNKKLIILETLRNHSL